MGFWQRLFGLQGTSGRPQPGASPASLGRSELPDAYFMAPLTTPEKVLVSNLNPLLYDVIIKEKEEGNAPAIVGLDETKLCLLRKLEVADLKKLAECVTLGMKADQQAASDRAEATRLYRKAMDLNPYNDVACMSYGCLLGMQGNLREGIKWVEKATQLNPNNETARANLRAMKADLR